MGLSGARCGRCDAGVGFVDDHQLGAEQRELVAAAALLDVVGGHDQVREVLVHGGPERDLAVDPIGGGGQQHLGPEPELSLQLSLPLRCELGGAQHHEPLGIATGDEFGGDQAGLDGLADPDTVGDEQPGGLLGGGHHQRDQLIVAGGDGELRERSERPGGGAEGQTQCVAEQPGASGVAPVGHGGGIERRRLRVIQRGQQCRGLIVPPAQGAREDGIGGATGQHQPLPSPGPHQGAGAELRGRHWFSRPAPKMPGF